jgi:hypothetical protein
VFYLVDCNSSTLSSVLNKYASVITKTLRLKPSNPWFTPVLSDRKLARHRLERIWFRTHSSDDLLSLRSATNRSQAAINKANRDYNSKLISSNLTNSRKLWHTINSLLHRKSIPVLPSFVCLKSLSRSFVTFFSDKIHSSILSQGNHSSPNVDLLSIPIRSAICHCRRSLNLWINHLLPAET